MPKSSELRVDSVWVALSTVFAAILLLTLFMQVGAQGMHVLCLDQPALAVHDTNGDKAITKAELDAAAENAPANKDLRDLKDRVEEGDFTEVQYTGQCHAEGEPGESVVVVSEVSATGNRGSLQPGEMAVPSL